jgi:hypothetical protein
MALDWKTLRVLAESHPRGADDYCPECGRPWREPSPERPRPIVRFPWPAALFGLIGLSLAITFGLRSVSAYQTEARAHHCAMGLPEARGNLLSTNGQTCWPANLGAAGWSALQEAAGRALHQDLLATAGGAVLILLGVDAWRRACLQARRLSFVWTVAVALWSLGEGVMALVCFQILALYLDLLVVRLTLGFPFTWETLDQTTNSILNVLSTLTDLP